tara:strand:- start:168 stop:308 length:141 start_codon:yes stop_codon:yes gene_type:complete
MPLVPSSPLPEAKSKNVSDVTEVTIIDKMIKLFIPTIIIVNNVRII